MASPQKTQVDVLLGAGGVGKTTCSIALAMAHAAAGRSVALLSIDPARRVAEALGIPLTGEFRRVPGDPMSGSLEAAILDQKAVFDSMVERFAPDPATSHKILDNKIYQIVSSRLSGSLEYMALARVQQLVDSGRYNVIVLDTPPDTHALDFLARPNVLENFMENKVMSWLIKPFYLASRLGMGRLFSLGERLMGGIAKITGIQSLHIIAEFLVLMQQVIAGFHRAGSAIKDTLGRKETRFIFVSTLQPAAQRAAVNLAHELHALGYQVDQVLFNRSLPTALLEAIHRYTAVHPRLPASEPLLKIFRRARREKELQTALVLPHGEVKSQLIPETAALKSLAELRGFSRHFAPLVS